MSRRRVVLALLLASAAVAIYASGVTSDLPDAETVIEDIAQGLGQWTYVAVGLFAFLETGAFVGLVAPGESVVIVGGVIAGQGEIELIPLIGLVWTCALLGDSTSFLIGRRLGRGFLLRHGPKLRVTEQRLGQVERYFQRRGGSTILIGRFIGLVRALAPFIAGSSGFRYGRFLPYSVIGTGLWASLFCVLGYLFYRSFDEVARIAGQATLGFGLTVGAAVGAVYAWRRLRREEDRRRLGDWFERQGRRPLLRPIAALILPLWRVAAPRLRFVGVRLTPGGLGLELTSALAVAAAGLYVFVLYTVVLSGDPGPTPMDAELLDVSRDLRLDPAVDTIKVVTELGSFPVTSTLVLVAAIVLAASRRPVALGALVIGALLVYVAVQETKAGIDRPRPGGSLVATSGEAFPSGHAAYSTTWVMVAAIAAWLLPGRVRGAALLLAAAATAAVVGLSRVYLGAHYWSDVAGGWGLGFGIFAAAAVGGLVVAHMRQNEPLADR